MVVGFLLEALPLEMLILTICFRRTRKQQWKKHFQRTGAVSLDICPVAMLTEKQRKLDEENKARLCAQEAEPTKPISGQIYITLGKWIPALPMGLFINILLTHTSPPNPLHYFLASFLWKRPIPEPVLRFQRALHTWTTIFGTFTQWSSKCTWVGKERYLGSRGSTHSVGRWKGACVSPAILIFFLGRILISIQVLIIICLPSLNHTGVVELYYSTNHKSLTVL